MLIDSSVSHIYSPGCTVFAGNWTSMDPSLCWHPGPVTSSKKAAGFRSLQGWTSSDTDRSSCKDLSILIVLWDKNRWSWQTQHQDIKSSHSWLKSHPTHDHIKNAPQTAPRIARWASNLTWNLVLLWVWQYQWPPKFFGWPPNCRLHGRLWGAKMLGSFWLWHIRSSFTENFLKKCLQNLISWHLYELAVQDSWAPRLADSFSFNGLKLESK